jgi:hypothetical protein
MFPVVEMTAVVAETPVIVAHDDILQILGVQEFDVVVLVLLLYFFVKFLVDPEQLFLFLMKPGTTTPISTELLTTELNLNRLNRMLDSLDRDLDRLDTKNWND